MPEPLTFCLIRDVSMARMPHGWGFTVTVADQKGTSVMLALQANDLATYERFQAAVLRETGCPFRYFPWDSHDHHAGFSHPAAP
jgi:hypothetical protein